MRGKWLPALVLVIAWPVAASAWETFSATELTVDTKSGPQRFAVEVAITQAQWDQGLMFRHSMAADAGMLFDLKKPTDVVMWMKNTVLPLDMLFVDASRKVIDIHEYAEPMSEAYITSKAPAQYVVELNAGTVSRLGIADGDSISSPYFAKSASKDRP